MSAFGDFYTAGETPRAPRAPSSALICDFVLMQCLLGNVRAGEWRAELYSVFFWGQSKETLINSTHDGLCCVMRCSECSHMFEYAALLALLLLALYSPQRITQSLPKTIRAGGGLGRGRRWRFG